MTDRRRNGTNPSSWLHVAGFVLLMWAVSSATLAQIREVLVTDVRGTAVRATGGAAPLRLLETLRVGERARLSTDSHVGLFNAADAQLYLVEGPAEVAVSARGVVVNGKVASPRVLDAAYRNIKAKAADLVQGSMVMRSGAPVLVLSPEGPTRLADARVFRWRTDGRPWGFELSTDDGIVVHRTTTREDHVQLPPEVVLKAGTKYVWGIRPPLGDAPPADWTDFVIDDVAGAVAPSAQASRSERVVHAAWLQSRSLPRAAARTLQGNAAAE